MADISALGLKEVDPIDFENEAVNTGGGGSTTPPEGKYTGRFTYSDDMLGATQNNDLKATFKEIEIIGTENGQGVGYKIKYQMPLSVKKYTNREGNSFLEFLRACGFAGRPTTNEEYIAALRQVSGRPFQFQLYWEGYDKVTGETTKFAENFPNDPITPSKKQPFFDVANPDDPDEKPRRVFANGKVKGYISAVKKA